MNRGMAQIEGVEHAAKFDWDEHANGHVLDIPGVAVLFIYPTNTRRRDEYQKARDALEVRSVSHDGKAMFGAIRLNLTPKSSITFMVEEDMWSVRGPNYSRIVIEDMDSAIDSHDLRQILKTLKTQSGVDPKLYLTYSDKPEVFILRPTEGEGSIDPAIQELARG